MQPSAATAVVFDPTNPYGNLIGSFFAGAFPAAVATDKSTQLDLVTGALVASGQVRYGPSPNPESLVAIRELVRECITSGKPIPILTPWGSKKPRNDGSLDVAEVGALKQLACLQARVQQYHAPGIELVIRVEDGSGYYLFEGDTAARAAIDQYSPAFVRLIKVLGLSGFIRPVLESAIFDERRYADMTDEVVPVVQAYIAETDAFGFDGYEERASWKRLHTITGVRGEIPVEQRNYYRTLYLKLFPGISPEEANRKLSRYLASAFVRSKIKGRADDPSWGGKYIQVTFAPPIPGAPAGMVSRHLYYRTLPLRMATTHIAPWRAKGYLKIRGREVTPKIVSWNEVPEDLMAFSVELNGNGDAVSVAADYLLVD